MTGTVDLGRDEARAEEGTHPALLHHPVELALQRRGVEETVCGLGTPVLSVVQGGKPLRCKSLDNLLGVSSHDPPRAVKREKRMPDRHEAGGSCAAEEVVALDKRNAHPRRRRADRRKHPGATAADDADIELAGRLRRAGGPGRIIAAVRGACRGKRRGTRHKERPSSQSGGQRVA